MYRELERRSKSDEFIIEIRSLFKREFRGGLSEYLDILLKLFVYEAIMSIEKAV